MNREGGPANLMSDPNLRSVGRFYGKYRGLVNDNKDPLGLGRLQVSVPAIPGMTKNWALPCTPYAGNQVGFYTIPPIGALAWVEFEGGDPAHPIWSGCFWQTDQVPSEVETNADDPSQVKVLKTRVASLWIDDTDQKGQVQLKFNDSTVENSPTITVVIDTTGLVITCQGSSATSKITMTPEDIQTSSTNLITDTSKNTTMTAKENISATASGNMTLEADGNLDATAKGDMTLKATGNLAASATQNLTLKGLDCSVAANGSFSASANTSATVSGKSSASLESTPGQASVTGTSNVSVSSVGSTKVSGALSLTLGGASINFSPA